MRHFSSFFLFLVIFSSVCFGQSNDSSKNWKETFAIHAKGGFLSNSYSADFRAFQGAIDCGHFTTGSGNGSSIMLFGEMPFTNTLTLDIGLGIVNRGGSLTVPGGFPSRDTSTGKVVDVQTVNELTAKLSYLEIQPEVRYTLLQKLINGPLRAMGALHFSLPITSTFAQTESITSPSNAVFISGGTRTQTRSVASGDMTSRNSMVLGASFGLENLLVIGKNLHLTQQICYDLSLGDVASDATWKTNALRFELGIRYAFTNEPPPAPPKIIEIPKPIPVDTPKPKPIVKVEPPKPTLNMKFDQESLNRLRAAIMETGNELQASLPIVNAVFFEQSSGVIPTKYATDQARTFKTDDAISLHRLILLNIADIVKHNPKAKITLRGATSGLEEEPDGISLAEERAKSVKIALVSLGVPTASITTKSQIFPQDRSNQDYPEGRAENRRVDILLENAPLQEYISKERYAELSGNLSGIITLSNFPVGELASITSNILDTAIMVSASGNVNLPFHYRLTAGTLKQGVSLHAQAQTLTQDGSSDAPLASSDSTTLDIASLKTNQVDLKLDDFEPVLRFEYNSADLSESNVQILRQMIKVLPKGANITVLGSSDALGSEKRNLELAAKRAQSIENFINSVAENTFKIVSSGSTAKFPDDTPEGRFLNRSIRVRVRK